MAKKICGWLAFDRDGNPVNDRKGFVILFRSESSARAAGGIDVVASVVREKKTKKNP